MSWLTLFNGVVAPLSNPPTYEQIADLRDQLEALEKKADLKIEVRHDGGLMVYRKARSTTSTVYSPGNADEFVETWLGSGALTDECQVYPNLATQPLNDEEREACLSAARKAVEVLRSVSPDVKAKGFHYGLCGVLTD